VCSLGGWCYKNTRQLGSAASVMVLPGFTKLPSAAISAVSRSVVFFGRDFLFYEQQQAARMYKSVFYGGGGCCSCRAFIRTGGIGNGVTTAGISVVADRRRPFVLWPFLPCSKVTLIRPDPSCKGF
jgi:hypothetical protein